MKRIFIIIAGVLLTASVFAQAPEKMSYQAVIRDADNNLVTNQAVGMQISILQTTVNGTAVYTETHTLTTNANGLASVEIGNGTVVSGDFATINWANGLYFIKTETDLTGGTSYTITGTSQLLSVPYALHAKMAETIKDPLWTINTTGISTNELVGIGTSVPDANLQINDNTGAGLLKMVSNDNIFTIWQSDRFGVDDYLVGIDGGNNKFLFGNLTTAQFPLVIHGDKIGIFELDPEAPLHINDFMKLEPRSSAPSSPTVGMIYYDSTDNKVKVYTGSSWENLN
jgi:hypothetical protein